jgi:hypothetical protein
MSHPDHEYSDEELVDEELVDEELVDEELRNLIREADELKKVPDHCKDPAAFARRCMEEAERQEREGIPLPALPDLSSNSPVPSPTPAAIQEVVAQQDRKRASVSEPPAPHVDLNEVRKECYFRLGGSRWFVAAGILLVITMSLVGYIVWPPRSVHDQRDVAKEPLDFRPEDQPAGLSGPSAPSPANRSEILFVPPLPAEVFGASGVGYAVAVEFAPGEPLRVCPDNDLLCPTVTPGKRVSVSSDPFVRPLSGQKWVVIIVSDRPAAGLLKSLIDAGHNFDRPTGPEATKEAVTRAIKAADCRVLAYGLHTLKPMTR